MDRTDDGPMDPTEDGPMDSVRSVLSVASRAVEGGKAVSVGVDVVSIDRFERTLAAEGFAERVFTPREIEYCESRFSPATHYAARWAAKEAVVKALPDSSRGIELSDVEVRRVEDGVELRVAGERPRFVEARASLSHDESANAALAFVVLVLESG